MTADGDALTARITELSSDAAMHQACAHFFAMVNRHVGTEGMQYAFVVGAPGAERAIVYGSTPPPDTLELMRHATAALETSLAAMASATGPGH